MPLDCFKVYLCKYVSVLQDKMQKASDIFFFTFFILTKMFSYCHVIFIIFFAPNVIYWLKFLFHIEALPQSLIHFCQNHVIYDIQSLVHLRTMWMLQFLVQKEWNPVRFSFLLFILFCFCFVFNNKYWAQCSFDYEIIVELGWVMVKNREITDFIYVFV